MIRRFCTCPVPGVPTGRTVGVLSGVLGAIGLTPLAAVTICGVVVVMVVLGRTVIVLDGSDIVPPPCPYLPPCPENIVLLPRS
jgi:hypothetical protein